MHSNIVSVFLIFIIGIVMVKELFSAPVIPQYRGSIDCQRNQNVNSAKECELIEVGAVKKCSDNTDYGVIHKGIVA